MASDRFRNYIGGEWVEADTEAFKEVRNPANGELLGEVPLSGPAVIADPVQVEGYQRIGRVHYTSDTDGPSLVSWLHRGHRHACFISTTGRGFRRWASASRRAERGRRSRPSARPAWLNA